MTRLLLPLGLGLPLAYYAYTRLARWLQLKDLEFGKPETEYPGDPDWRDWDANKTPKPPSRRVVAFWESWEEREGEAWEARAVRLQRHMRDWRIGPTRPTGCAEMKLQSLASAVYSGDITPNEGRAELGLPPITGNDRTPPEPWTTLQPYEQFQAYGFDDSTTCDAEQDNSAHFWQTQSR